MYQKGVSPCVPPLAMPYGVTPLRGTQHLDASRSDPRDPVPTREGCIHSGRACSRSQFHRLNNPYCLPNGPDARPAGQQTDVLLALQPVHLDNILAGQKNHEYRKYPASRWRGAAVVVRDTWNEGENRICGNHVSIISPDRPLHLPAINLPATLPMLLGLNPMLLPR